MQEEMRVRCVFHKHFDAVSGDASFNALQSLLVRLGKNDKESEVLIDSFARSLGLSRMTDSVHYSRFLDWVFKDDAEDAVLPATIATHPAHTLYAQGSEQWKYNGISVHYMSTALLGEIQAAGFGSDANFYSIEAKVIRPKGKLLTCPRDGKLGTSYVDALQGEDNVGHATLMLSYTWAYSVRNVADALRDYCGWEDLDTRRTYVWICSLCINQHRVREALMQGASVPFDHFKQEFGDRVREIGRVVALMEPWHAPTYISRVWCNFEMFCAITACTPVSIIMPPKESKKLQESLLQDKGLDEVWRALCNLKVEHSEASVAEDRQRIFQMIEEGPGFNHLNKCVRRRLQTWIVDSAEHHARACLTSRENIDPIVFRLCAKVGSLLREIGLGDRGSQLLDDAWELYEGSAMTETPQSAYLLRQIGIMKEDGGDINGAAHTFSQVHAIYQRLQMLETPNGALLLSNIGVNMALQGNYIGALETYETAQQVAEKSGVLETMIGAILLRNVGVAKLGIGDLKGALDIFAKAYNIHVQTNTVDSPMGAVLQKHIAIAKHKIGDHPGALRAARRSFSLAEDTGTFAVLGDKSVLTEILHEMDGTVTVEK